MSALLRLRLLYLAQQADEASRQRDSRRKRRRNLRCRRLAAKAADAFTMSDREFVKSYRLPKDSVRKLINELRPHIRSEKRRDGLDCSTKVFIALAFYATGSYQTLVGQSYHHAVSQSSVSRAVREVTKGLNIIFKNYVQFPLTREARENVRRRFYNKFGIPGVLGCIDGTHVAIVRPAEREDLYYCRKGYHSLNVMIICDADLNIICVDPSHPGKSHDSTIWRDHPLNDHITQLCDSGETNFLLGDSGYPLRRTLLTPVLNTEPGSPENYYYNKHVKTRNVVERTIGILKARFRCLLVARQLHYSPDMAAKIVNACCVLHNIANAARVGVPDLTERERDEEQRLQVRMMHDETVLHNSDNADDTPLSQGRALRASLVESLWQNRF